MWTKVEAAAGASCAVLGLESFSQQRRAQRILAVRLNVEWRGALSVKEPARAILDPRLSELDALHGGASDVGPSAWEEGGRVNANKDTGEAGAWEVRAVYKIPVAFPAAPDQDLVPRLEEVKADRVPNPWCGVHEKDGEGRIGDAIELGDLGSVRGESLVVHLVAHLAAHLRRHERVPIMRLDVLNAEWRTAERAAASVGRKAGGLHEAKPAKGVIARELDWVDEKGAADRAVLDRRGVGDGIRRGRHRVYRCGSRRPDDEEGGLIGGLCACVVWARARVLKKSRGSQKCCESCVARVN